jgi:hypothetical protein
MYKKINDMHPQNGRHVKEDGFTVNLADIFNSVYDRDELVMNTMPYIAIKNGYSFASGKIFNAVPSNGYAVMRMTTGSKFCYVNYTVASDGFCFFGTHHDVVTTSPGTPHFITNRNHMQSETPTADIYHTPTYTQLGTRSVERMNTVGGGPAKGGGVDGDAMAFVVRPNSEVYFVAQNKSKTNTNINIVINWFEKGV